jgi:pimeloyl-ACP methyl ester carboxylesterase
MKQRARLALLLLVAVGAVVFQSYRGKAAGSSPEKRERARFLVPQGATTFTFGRLRFERCELAEKRSAATTEAYCAPFEVPEDWDAPEGRKIALRLALVASREPAANDFIVLLAGGPGQSAIDNWPQIAAPLAPASKRRHVLLLDQRGTGGSNPLDCKGAGNEDELPDFDLARLREETRACLTRVQHKADPRHYTTTAAVRDLEALREALGHPSFDLVGISYGTRVAQQYLKRYPEGVRSVVLDGPVPNDLVVGAEFAGNLEDALRAQFALCTEDPACARAFGDPYAALTRLRDELRARPREVSFPDPVTFQPRSRRLDGDGLTTLVRIFAYAPETASLIPLAVREAAAGNYAPLMGQLALVTGNLEELVGSGMQLSVLCAEDADRLAPDPRAAATLLGNATVEALRAQCAVWPRGERPADFHEPVTGNTPVLVLAGEFDPVTPARYGEAIVEKLGNAKLIVARGQGHNVIGRGCLPKVVERFMDKLDARGLDTTCTDAFAATPPFIDFNGAAR